MISTLSAIPIPQYAATPLAPVATPQETAPTAPSESVTLTPFKERHPVLHTMGRAAFGLVRSAAMGGASAAAGWLGGGYGILASGGVGAAWWARGEDTAADRANGAMAGAMTGLIGGIAGCALGPIGVGLMAAMGASRKLMAYACELMEDGRIEWSPDA